MYLCVPMGRCSTWHNELGVVMTVMTLIDSVVKRILTAKFSHAVSSDGDEGLTPGAKLEAMMHAVVPRSVLEVSTLPAV